MKNTELKAKDDEINEKALWVIGLSVVAALLVLTSIFLPTHIYKKRTKHFNKKINDLEEDFENKNYKLRLEKKDAELKLLGNLAYNHDIRKFIPIFPRMIKKTNEFNKALHQKVATAYAKYNKLNNDVVDELLNTVENEIEIVRQSNEVILFLRKMDVTYTLHTNFTDDDELRNILIPKNMFTSFISNSLLHGSIGKKHINIICTIRRVKNGYEFTLEDDGVGFKELGIENKKNDRGIPLLLRQVHNFNEENKIWNLGFDINSIQNKKQGKGVIVTFNMIKI
jgi:Skp family chaperone for outer membrane proteins